MKSFSSFQLTLNSISRRKNYISHNLASCLPSLNKYFVCWWNESWTVFSPLEGRPTCVWFGCGWWKWKYQEFIRSKQQRQTTDLNQWNVYFWVKCARNLSFFHPEFFRYLDFSQRACDFCLQKLDIRVFLGSCENSLRFKISNIFYCLLAFGIPRRHSSWASELREKARSVNRRKEDDELWQVRCMNESEIWDRDDCEKSVGRWWWRRCDVCMMERGAEVKSGWETRTPSEKMKKKTCKVWNEKFNLHVPVPLHTSELQQQKNRKVTSTNNNFNGEIFRADFFDVAPMNVNWNWFDLILWAVVGWMWK